MGAPRSVRAAKVGTSLRTGHPVRRIRNGAHRPRRRRAAHRRETSSGDQRDGCKTTEVDSAVQIIGELPEPSNLFARYAARPVARSKRRTSSTDDSGHVLANLPTEVKLALEMAAHEETERRALEGELAILKPRGSKRRRSPRSPTTCSCPLPRARDWPISNASATMATSDAISPTR